jgi:hypothetical protein
MAPPNGGAFDFPQRVLRFGSAPSQLFRRSAFQHHPSLEVGFVVPLKASTASRSITAVTARAGISVDVTFDETYIHLQGDV